MNIVYALLISLIINGALGWAAVHEYGSVRSADASCTAQRHQDAQDETMRVNAVVTARVNQDAIDRDAAVAAQARADATHEKVMLGIQHRQDLATLYFGDASHDPAATAWAAQPIPAPYRLGVCAVLAYCADAGADAPGRVFGSFSPGRGSVADLGAAGAAAGDGGPDAHHPGPS